MRLEDFVAETLTEIINGVHRAQNQVAETGARVSPSGFQVPFDRLEGRKWNRENGDTTETVEFDVAVTATEGTEAKGGIGVFVGAVGLGSQGRSEAKNSSVSRIKFSVPVVLPVDSQ